MKTWARSSGPVGRILCCVMVLGICLLLKLYYRSADSQDLFWILAPTAQLVELFSGLDFVNEPGLGWFNQLHKALIAPSCSGVNFLMIVFCMSSFQVVFSQVGESRLFRGILIAGLGAYGVTLLVNSLRIWVSILLLQADIYSGWLTVEAVHRIGGVMIYYLVLCFYYLLVSSILKRASSQNQVSGTGGFRVGHVMGSFVPLAWYLLFALGVPFLNDAYGRQPDMFMDHVLAVGTTAVVLTGFVMLGILGFYGLLRGLQDKIVR